MRVIRIRPFLQRGLRESTCLKKENIQNKIIVLLRIFIYDIFLYQNES